MLSVAVCDDEKTQRERTAALLRAYFDARPALEGRVFLFPSAAALLTHVDAHGGMDVYVLDIIMPAQNGIELGLALRRRDERGLIIYLTTSPDFAVDSYQTRAFHYLLKPTAEQPLFDALDRAVAHLRADRGEGITVRTRDGLRRLELPHIVWAQLYGRCLRYRLRDGTLVDSVTLRGSFREEAAPLLSARGFAAATASSVVNLRDVAGVGREGLRLRDGSLLPLSRSRREEVTRLWMDFHLEEGL